MTPNDLTLSRLPSPLGDLLLVSDAEGRLWASEYADLEERLHRLLARRIGAHALKPGAAPALAAQALEAYFSGEVEALGAIPIRLNGTGFQNKAWAALREIPAGRPVSYAEQAARLGDAKAARAVGGANRQNPYNLVAPCHRVVGYSGALTGYAGGLERKTWLLEHEGEHACSRLI
ncbi:methylated-DNA--[protein]-cysteine S-methyltransferase [Neomegalonema sp.]|uniref:methylated-DNA--[protein]-cysteine S-methyltransferase n=1 Tax=Neomegalonema sp. TaxID=2039713 RepID=UPI00261CD212|nr:methylated-DNA--[protein]-cysteine S-methyltransferase [Neomegalonema sp.]MDD2870253.1 methylated-DNA--[protein]-cysteine S-methyltransferase [Neomegalonema sp.]